MGVSSNTPEGVGEDCQEILLKAWELSFRRDSVKRAKYSPRNDYLRSHSEAKNDLDKRSQEPVWV